MEIIEQHWRAKPHFACEGDDICRAQGSQSGTGEGRTDSLLLNNGSRYQAVGMNAVLWKPPEPLPEMNCLRGR